MSDDFYDFDDREAESQGRGHLFLWTIFLLLLVGIAFACWIGSFYVFGHPEEARPYHILQKLHKLDPPKRFEITAAPPGDFLSAQKLFDRYSKYSPMQLANENADLMRDYIKNFKETKRLVPYVTGKYEIINAYELGKPDIVTSGMVALAASADHPQVLIEHVYPTAPENIGKLRTLLQPGLDLKLEKTLDLAAVVHIERTRDGRMLFTVVPLLYGSYAMKQGVGTFSLEPPNELNIPGGLPIVRGNSYLDAMKHYAEFRKTKSSSDLEEPGKPAKEPELVRLDTVRPGDKVPETGALPDIPIATPIPAATPKIVASRSNTPGKIPHGMIHPGTPPPQFAVNPTPYPRIATPIPGRPPVGATPMPGTLASNGPPTTVPPSVPAATPPTISPSGVPLKPFIVSTGTDPSIRPATGNWRTYNPGQQPPGRTITTSEASSLAERGDLGERLYLRGSFVVTAAGENRAVLRSQGAAGDPSKPGTGSARVIVEYPSVAAPPPEGSTFSRDETRGFEVRDVRRGADGQINIYVREVTLPH